MSASVLFFWRELGARATMICAKATCLVSGVAELGLQNVAISGLARDTSEPALCCCGVDGVTRETVQE
jgi:hypothetical protein